MRGYSAVALHRYLLAFLLFILLSINPYAVLCPVNADICSGAN